MQEKVRGAPHAVRAAPDRLHECALRAARGDESAATELVSALSNRLLRTATLILQDRALAEDALQETFITVIRRADQFVPHHSFERWVYRILVNQCRSFQRSPKHRPWFTLGTDPEGIQQVGEPMTGSHEATTDPAQKVAQHDAIQATLRQLPIGFRTVLVLYYFEDRSIEEIAGMMGVRVGTVKSQLHRARRRLQQIVEGEAGR